MEFYKQRIILFTIIIFLIIVISSIFPTFINNQLNIQPVTLKEISDSSFLIKINKKQQLLIQSLSKIKNEKQRKLLIKLIQDHNFEFKREYWFTFFIQSNNILNIYIKSKYIDLIYNILEDNNYYIIELTEIYSEDNKIKFFTKVEKENPFIKDLFLLQKNLI